MTVGGTLRRSRIPRLPELATVRALTDLGHRLLLTAATDIEAVTDERVQLRG